MPESPRVWYTRCPSCREKLRQGTACEHVSINENGQVYELHPQHQFEPALYAEVWFEIESASTNEE